MNTTEKGISFELFVFGIIQNLLQNKELGIEGQFYEVFHHKEYYSQSRQGNICVDISIEFSRKQNVRPFLYVFVECKDYKTSIPVNDIEELYSKTQQIAGVNVKAMLFTRSSLQQSAFNFADSKGIAVVRILDDDSLQWLIERTNKTLTTGKDNAVAINIINALINEYFVSVRQNTFGYVNGMGSHNISDILSSLLKNSGNEG